MPYHLEKGPTLVIIEKYLNAGPNAPDSAAIRSAIAKNRAAASSKPPSLRK